MSDERPKAPALNRGMRVLEVLARTETPLTMTRIAAEVGVSASSIQRIIGELLREGYISRTSTNGYYLTDRLYHLAFRGPQTQSLAYYALEPMREFVDRTRESAHVSIGMAERFVVVGQVESTDLVRVSVRQGSYPLEHHPSGWVLLAFDAPETWLPAARRRPLEARLQEVREQGWAFGPSLNRVGIYHLAVPVRMGGDTVLGVMATSFALPADFALPAAGGESPDPRTHRDALLPELIAAAGRIARAAGASG